MICFADDTTLLERETATLGRKQLVTRVSADWKENVHPGKWHHLRVRHSSEVPVVAEVVRRRVCGKRAAVTPEPPSRSLTGRGSTSQYLGVRLRHKQPHPVVLEDHVELLGSILSADGSSGCCEPFEASTKSSRSIVSLGAWGSASVKDIVWWRLLWKLPCSMRAKRDLSTRGRWQSTSVS